MTPKEKSNTVLVMPEFGHPSSLWADVGRVVERPFILPEDLGLSPELSERIGNWTKQFQQGFVDYSKGFNSRPVWGPGIDALLWYEAGIEIVEQIRREIPERTVKQGFDRYVFAINEIRRRDGLPDFDPPRQF